MPSAATNKCTDKAAEAAAGGETPLTTIITTIEHKIRNLEKRKTKLDGYRELQKSGTKLSADQREAVKKYDEVVISLDLAKELCKQFSQVVKEANREAKRESKRNAFLKIQQESSKIREVLIIQDILRSLADDSVRQDFLDGTNGAVRIDQVDMDLLEKLYVEVTPKRPSRSDEATFVACATHSANTLSSVIDARPKSFVESTYEHIRDILQRIQNSGYFEKDIQVVEDTAAASDDQEEGMESEENVKTEAESAIEGSSLIEAPAAKSVPVPNEQLIHSNPSPQLMMHATTTPTPPIVASAVSTANVQLNKDPLYPPMPPNTVAVRAVEYGLQKQYLQQQVRPIQEVIGQANFFFLQDSELEGDEFAVVPAPSPQKPQQAQIQPNVQQQTMIPTVANAILPQSFTNQSFSMVPPPQQMAFNPNPLKSSDVPQQHIPIGVPQLAQPVQQIMQQQAAVVAAAVASNVDQHPLRPMPGFVSPQMAQIAQMQTIMQQQQQLPQTNPAALVSAHISANNDNTNALTEKLKSTLHINDSSKPSSAQSHQKSSASIINSSVQDETKDNNHDWNEVNDRNNDASNSWSNEVENTYSSRGPPYKPRNTGIGAGGNGGYNNRSDNKYGGNKQQYGGDNNKYGSGGGDNKYPSSYRSRNSTGGGYQNGGGNSNNRDVFFQNNDRSYYQNGGNNNSGNNGGGNDRGGGNNYKPRNDLMRNSTNNYRSQQRSNGNGGNNGAPSGRNDRDRGIKA